MTQFANYPSLENGVVCITGGGGGIGASIVTHFCAQNSQVAFIDKDVVLAEQLLNTLSKQYSVSPLFVPCDLRDISSLKNALHEIKVKLGDISILVNNAANDMRHPTLEMTESQWRSTLADNLDHYFFAIQAVLPDMMKNREGSIINISSNCFLATPEDEYIGYATSKAAIFGMSRMLARQYGKYNIRCNCLMPGWVMTQRQLEQWLTPDAEAELLRSQCLKEKLYPEDIARMVLFLASEDSRMCTKMGIVLDGGRT